jgi:hypothetical protein
MTRPGEDAVSRPRPWRAIGLIGALLAVVALVAVWALVATPRPTQSAVAGASAPASVAPSAVPSGASSASSGPSIAPGGKVAEALVAALHVDPFVAHVDEAILASTITNGRRLTITANAVGDVSGPDVAIRTTGTGNGPATDEQIVTIGDVAWIRPTKATAWEVHPRSLVAPSLEGLLSTIQPLDDPQVLVDMGIEDLDGVKVHHLTAVGAVAYHSLNGIDGLYDTFDIWATDTGIPVLMKATFSEVQDVNSITGSTEIRYSKVGGPITITAPAGAPSLAP